MSKGTRRMRDRKTNSCGQVAQLIILLFAFGFGASLSFAHEKKAALTDIFFNERTGNLEVAHRFILHDAEHTLHKATELKGDLARSNAAQAAFAKYVAGRFALRLNDKDRLKLTLVGQELDRGYLWVYQETKIPDPLSTSFLIENTILQDVVKGQVNTVNVRYGKHVSTFVFTANTGPKLYVGPVDNGRKRDAGER